MDSVESDADDEADAPGASPSRWVPDTPPLAPPPPRRRPIYSDVPAHFVVARAAAMRGGKTKRLRKITTSEGRARKLAAEVAVLDAYLIEPDEGVFIAKGC